MTKRVLIVGGGIIGLCVAYYCARQGNAVTVLERGQPERDGCSFANAGMVVPSHFVPLASPGVIQLALRWMWNPESPFHVRPRFSAELLDWGWKLYRAATAAREADEFVLCAGIWSKELVRDLGLVLPMQAGKGYSLTLQAPPMRPRICALLSEARVAMTPMGESLRFGGTMELAGIDETVNPIRIRGIVKSVTRYYPDVRPSHFERASIRSALRPCSSVGLT